MHLVLWWRHLNIVSWVCRGGVRCCNRLTRTVQLLLWYLSPFSDSSNLYVKYNQLSECIVLRILVIQLTMAAVQVLREYSTPRISF